VRSSSSPSAQFTDLSGGACFTTEVQAKQDATELQEKSKEMKVGLAAGLL
jgi:hypothetical protein